MTQFALFSTARRGIARPRAEPESAPAPRDRGRSPRAPLTAGPRAEPSRGQSGVELKHCSEAQAGR